MFNYTDHVRVLMEDIVRRVPRLSDIDLRDVLVFGRLGRSETHGVYAACHSLTLPDSDPAYYFWRDGRTGRLTRRSEWFVTRSPEVRVNNRRLKYMISITLPRFPDQTIRSSRKEHAYATAGDWLAKLDTIVHELYHIDPRHGGIRRSVKADGQPAEVPHTPQFFADVAAMVHAYLDSAPDPGVYEFLQHDFAALVRRYGSVVATTFRSYPSFPQRYRIRLEHQPHHPRAAHVLPLGGPMRRHRFTQDDLELREFTLRSTRPVTKVPIVRAASRGIHPQQPASLAARRKHAS
ncbi:MAG: hypothetical protein AB1806_02900 [Acidobacteriota bacterium]